jgi:hypothetical protein
VRPPRWSWRRNCRFREAAHAVGAQRGARIRRSRVHQGECL